MSIYVNGQAVAATAFAGGECHVKIDPHFITEITHITAHLYNADAIMCLLLTIDAIRRINAAITIDLTVPYFPYARQDRVCNRGEALSVRVMADLINNLACNSVTIIDPHSDVTPALLHNVRTMSMSNIVAHGSLAKFIAQQRITLLAPDAGAEKKVLAVAKALAMQNIATPVVYAILPTPIFLTTCSGKTY
jgi:ribose-phosphate pyrophosphokinase